MSGATWFQQLVAQLGYQPCTMKVTINANEIFDVIPNIKSNFMLVLNLCHLADDCYLT